MAKIQLGGIISDITGSIGGTTFQRGNGVYVARKKSIPRKFNSSLQQLTLKYLSTINAAWNDLSVEELHAFDGWAAMLQIYKHKQFKHILSGIELFRQINFYRAANNLALITSAPMSYYNAEPANLSDIISGADLIVEFDRVIDSTNETAYIFLSSPVSNKSRQPGNKLRLMSAAQTSVTQFTVTESYTNAFGNLITPGSYIWIKFCIADKINGLPGAWYTTIGQVS
jgi:hypothetical protein